MTEEIPSETVKSANELKQGSGQEPEYSREFETDLQSSRVYGRMASKDKRASVASSHFSRGWSFLSTASLSDVSNISVVSLPLSSKELWNHQRYDQVGPIESIDTALLHPWYNPPTNVRLRSPSATRLIDLTFYIEKCLYTLVAQGYQG